MEAKGRPFDNELSVSFIVWKAAEADVWCVRKASRSLKTRFLILADL